MVYINANNLKVKFPQVVATLPDTLTCINQTSKEVVEMLVNSYEIDFQPFIELFSDA